MNSTNYAAVKKIFIACQSKGREEQTMHEFINQKADSKYVNDSFL